jgi:hypothetical protein
MTERPTQLRVVRDTVPEGINAAVAKALAKVPADRFPSASAFAAELARPARSAAGGRRPRWLAPAAAGLVLVALAATAWALTRTRSTSAAFTPQLEQLTTDGNARHAALSPDGGRLAYVARDCDAHERCTDRLVVRDTGGAGSINALVGRSVSNVRWATGGRFLVADVTDATGRRGMVAVPALGGTPRFLGCCIGVVVGTSDTLLLGPLLLDNTDSLVWMRFLTVSDGLARDSMPVRHPGMFNIGIPAPVGDRVMVASLRIPTWTVRLMDRTGRVTDSLPATTDFPSHYWTPRADALLWTASVGSAGIGFPSASVLLRRQVSAEGRLVGTTDTLMRLQPGSSIPLLRNDGTALLLQGPVDAVVYALERPRMGRLNFVTRRLASSTAGMQAALSRDGEHVWLLRRGEGAGSTRRDAFIPFTGERSARSARPVAA